MNSTKTIGGKSPGKLRTSGHEQTKPGSRQQNKPTSGKKWLEYTALATVPLVLVLGNSMLVPILPDLQKQLKVSGFQSSLVISLFSIAAGVIIPLMGYLSDRFARKKIILASLALYGVAGIAAGLGALWHSYGLLITARAFQGFGAAGTSPIAMALVGDMYKDGEESEALGLIEASNGAGKVLSPIIGSLLAMIAWYAPLFAFPFFCAASFAAMLFFIKEPESKQEPPTIKQYIGNIVQLFREKGRWLLSAFISGSLGLFIMFGVLFRLSDILEKAPYHIDGVAKGGILAIPLLGLVITAYLTGHHIKNNGVLMRRLMLTGLGLMVLSLGAAAFFYKNVWIIIALATISSVGTGLLLPCLNTLITGAVDRQHRGMITSLYSSLRFLGVAFGPPLFGWLASRSDMLLYGVVAALSLAGLGLVAAFVHPPKQAGDTAG